MPFNLDVLIKGLSDTFNPDFKKLGPDFRKIREEEQKQREFAAEQREFTRQQASRSTAAEARAIASHDEALETSDLNQRKLQEDLDDEDDRDALAESEMMAKKLKTFSDMSSSGNFDIDGLAKKLGIENPDHIGAAKANLSMKNAATASNTAYINSLAERSKATNPSTKGRTLANIEKELFDAGMDLAEKESFGLEGVAPEKVVEIIRRSKEQALEIWKSQTENPAENRVNDSRKMEGLPPLDFSKFSEPGQSRGEPALGRQVGAVSEFEESQPPPVEATPAERELGGKDPGELNPEEVIGRVQQAVVRANQGDQASAELIRQVAEGIGNGSFDDDPELVQQLQQLIAQFQGQ
jgi:hypothetical protein